MRGQLLAIALGALVACVDDDQGSVVEVATLSWDTGEPGIYHPEEGLVGEAIEVRIVTVGDGCVSFESTEIETTSNGFRVTPMNRRRYGRPCPLKACSFEHHADLVFDTAGTHSFVVRAARGDDIVDFERVVEIRE